MKDESKTNRRSNCPLSVALEVFGDKWTILILRDLLFRNCSTFREFQESSERIATNILSDRLKRLQQHGMIVCTRSETDARVISYRPTSKSLDLMPVMFEMILWATRHEQVEFSPAILRRLRADPHKVIAEIRRRFPDVAAE